MNDHVIATLHSPAQLLHEYRPAHSGDAPPTYPSLTLHYTNCLSVLQQRHYTDCPPILIPFDAHCCYMGSWVQL